MKTIAIVFNRMVVGGAERSLIDLLNMIDPKKCQVTLFTYDQNGAFLDEVPSTVRIRYFQQINMQHRLWDDLRHFRLRDLIRGLYHRLQIRLHKDPYLKYTHTNLCFPPIPDRFDIAIAYKFGWEDTATTLFRIKAAKYCSWVHQIVDPAAPRDKYLIRYGKKMDALFCVSKDAKARFDLMYPEFCHKTSVIHNIIDPVHIMQRASEEADTVFLPTSILTVGRLVDIKGQDMIPAIVRILLDHGHDVHWYLIGDGALRQKILHQIEVHHVAGHVHLLGPRANPYPYMKRCHIYVQTSLSEGWCLTTQEAKILCRPVVTTALPVMDEQFTDGFDGSIAKETSPEALANSILDLLENPEKTRKITQNLMDTRVCVDPDLQKFYHYIEH